MIHAINEQGREAYFTERVWDLLPKHKNGWREFSAESGEVQIPQQIIEFQKKLSDEKVVAVVEEEKVENTTINPPVVEEKKVETPTTDAPVKKTRTRRNRTTTKTAKK